MMENKNKYQYKFIVIWVIVLLLNSNLMIAQDKSFFAGSSGSESFNDIFVLSDSTVLVAGNATDMTWLPNGVTPVVLSTTGTNFVAGSDQTSTPFLLHLSKGMETVLNVAILPSGSADNFNRIEATSPPGQPTGNLYVSGKNIFPGTSHISYFVAKLDNNFVNGVPTKLDMVANLQCNFVSTGGKHGFDGPSEHADRPPWDVKSDGTVIAGRGGEFHFDWAIINVIDPITGNETNINGATWHVGTFGNNTGYPLLNNVRKEFYGNLSNNGKIYVSEITIKNASMSGGDSLLVVNDSVEFIGESSGWVIKSNRAGYLRSTNNADYSMTQNDENGLAGRPCKYPGDLMQHSPCIPFGSCPGNNIFQAGPYGHHTPDIFTGQIGDVVIDKRNDNIYFAYNMPTGQSFTVPSYANKPQGGSTDYNFETYLVCANHEGIIQWWANGYHMDINTAAQQFTRDLEIDYTNNKLIMLGLNVDTLGGTFWGGDQINANPGGNGFQNQPTTATSNDLAIYQSWIGKYDLVSGTIEASTWLTELDANYQSQGSSLSGMLADWPNRNMGNYPGAVTKAERVAVGRNGEIGVIGFSEGRTMTSLNALQHMPKNQQGMHTHNQFVRVYSPDLSQVTYSSLATGTWDKNTGFGGNNTELYNLSFYRNTVFAVGTHMGLGEDIAIANVPTWGSNTKNSTSAIVYGVDYKDQTITGLDVANHSEVISGSTALYPNPAKRSINLEILGNDIKGRVNVQVIDVYGRVVAQNYFDKGSSTLRTTLPLHNISAGTYFVRIENNGGSATKKIMVE